MDVTLMQMLEARERRVLLQQELLARFGKPLICFTMNIAGPVKYSPLIHQGFQIGCRRLEGQLAVGKIPVLFSQQETEATGCQAVYVLDGAPAVIKAIATDVEESAPLGRLFDMDVIVPGGEKVERPAPRLCLLCGNQAQACARSRTHSVAQLQERTNQILQEAVDAQDTDDAAVCAVKGLLYEVGATPKPGLVDRADSGSHRDMDFFSFQASAAALFPYFRSCTDIGRRTRQALPQETFRALRLPGRLAEGEMLRATGGVNTHKGAIFSLGILCGAMGRLDRSQWTAQELLGVCAEMTAGLTAGDYAGLTEATARTAGQRLYLRHGITGVRGQAEAGFPAVLNIGLPALRSALSQGASINDAACAALMALLAGTVDTNMINRSSFETQQAVSHEIQELLRQSPLPTREVLSQWNARFVAENLSPGGSADLLAMSLMLLFVEGEMNHV